jgi:hypothetical protein
MFGGSSGKVMLVFQRLPATIIFLSLMLGGPRIAGSQVRDR